MGSIPKGNVQIEDQFTSEYKVSRPVRRGGQVDVKFSPRRTFDGDAIAYAELLDKGSAIRFSC